MSTDCENLLKRFLVLNPMKRGVLTNIMNDKWININYEADNLQPYKEPDLFNALSEDRIGKPGIHGRSTARSGPRVLALILWFRKNDCNGL